MRPFAEQHKLMQGVFTSPVSVLRLLTPLKMSYAGQETRRTLYQNRGELPEMRQDTGSLVRQAVSAGRLRMC